MDKPTTGRLDGLPPQVVTSLSEFVAKAQAACGDDLLSVVLFGNAAEGRLNPKSEINVLVVLRAFAPDRIGAMGETLLAAEAAIRLKAMFLLQQEIDAATDVFGQKFVDMLRRHRTIHGAELFATLEVSRRAKVLRLRQVLLDLTFRLRGEYATHGQHKDKIRRLLADTFTPLRDSCATLLEMEKTPTSDPSVAMEMIAVLLDARYVTAIANITAAHAGQPFSGAPADTLGKIIEFIMHLSDRAKRLS